MYLGAALLLFGKPLWLDRMPPVCWRAFRLGCSRHHDAHRKIRQ
jgi:hypothetical protein